MRELTLEEIGVDLDRVIRLLGGEEKVIRSLGPEKVLQHLLVWLHSEKLEEMEEIGVDLDRVIRLLGGEEKVLQHFDERQTMISLVHRLGKEQAHQLLEEISKESAGDKAS